MKKRFIQFLISVTSLLIFISGCNSQETPASSEFVQLSNYFEELHHIKVDNKISSIFILREDGCISCNKAFAQLIQENINNTASLFLIAVTGTRLDLSEFDKSKDNVFFNKKLNLSKYPLLNESKVYFLQDNKIDTVIRLNASRLSEDLDYIQKSIIPDFKF